MDDQTGPAGVGPREDGGTEPGHGPGRAEPAAAGDDTSSSAHRTRARDQDTAAAGQDAAAAEDPATGDARVDTALKLLDRLPGLPVSEHAELFEQVHAQLSDVLAELDPGSTGTSG